MEYSIFIIRRSVYRAGIKIWRYSKNSVFISRISFNISKSKIADIHLFSQRAFLEIQKYDCKQDKLEFENELSAIIPPPSLKARFFEEMSYHDLLNLLSGYNFCVMKLLTFKCLFTFLVIDWKQFSFDSDVDHKPSILFEF